MRRNHTRRNKSYIIARRIQVEGFLYGDFIDAFPEFHAQAEVWLKNGLIQEHHTEMEGIERVIEAFRGLFTGENVSQNLKKLSLAAP